ncbi:cell wall hydrolase/autolysin [Thermodesulfobium narugense DSM 14796]|uniref:N-acetylmuramoyl-L-alanine amidase n=1 Tax=Thermodesulfobium narugense DSM 14796 TaxID=747365 RepID=M1E540_9BACT|nr:N-acetylmuramoyl-L-alanine amidase [Thermodesulfobium narugense]AEE14787.1 cell wall hydrolase/autolysin [Thermodesulfobium narugense DSM 14796]
MKYFNIVFFFLCAVIFACSIAKAEELLTVQNVFFKSSQDNNAVVFVQIQGEPKYSYFRLDDGRIVLNIENSKIIKKGAIIPASSSGVVSEIHFAQNTPDMVRIVVGSNVKAPYNITKINGGILISVGSSTPLISLVNGITSELQNVVPYNYTPEKNQLASNQTSQVNSSVSSSSINTLNVKNSKIIVIDPGHGGSDPGCVANGVQEKIATLGVALHLKPILEKMGFKVIMTRETDRDVWGRPNMPGFDADESELQARVNIANENGAALFLSIHFNACADPSIHGTQVYYYTPQSFRYASIMINDIAKVNPVYTDKPIRRPFWVIKYTTMPSILIETDFITNPSVAAQVYNPAYQEKIAQAIAQGIYDSYKEIYQ